MTTTAEVAGRHEGDAEQGRAAARLAAHEVSHDLRTSLATIRMIAAAMRTDPATGASAERLQALEDEVSTAEALLRAALHGPPAAEAVELEPLVQRCVRMARWWSSCRVTVRAEGRTTVTADRLQVRRMISNLLQNAVRAAGDDGEVEVTLGQQMTLLDEDPPHASVVLQIADSGAGFGLGPAGTASTGLHIVQTAVEQMHGSVVVTRSRLGGALVAVALPLR